MLSWHLSGSRRRRAQICVQAECENERMHVKQIWQCGVLCVLDRRILHTFNRPLARTENDQTPAWLTSINSPEQMELTDCSSPRSTTNVCSSWNTRFSGLSRSISGYAWCIMHAQTLLSRGTRNDRLQSTKALRVTFASSRSCNVVPWPIS